MDESTEAGKALEWIEMDPNPDIVLGHAPIGRRANIRLELRRLRRDPLGELVEAIDGDESPLLGNPRTRYQDAYCFYYLSLDRYLHEMSVAARYSRGPDRRSGGRQKFNPAQRKLAAQQKQVARFYEYDLVNCLIHSRILLDRVAGISQSFLTGAKLPSFTSFSKHKKFFADLTAPYGLHEEYAQYIRTQTDWFEMPLREVRDKFVVHAAPKHMRFLGYSGGRGEHELDLNIILPDDKRSLAAVKVISVNALRLAYDMDAFLKWVCQYGLKALHQKLEN
ncbi:MAG: hypothetical protein WAN14_15515 [Candidatus Acidiferrales bacterium]